MLISSSTDYLWYSVKHRILLVSLNLRSLSGLIFASLWTLTGNHTGYAQSSFDLRDVVHTQKFKRESSPRTMHGGINSVCPEILVIDILINSQALGNHWTFLCLLVIAGDCQTLIIVNIRWTTCRSFGDFEVSPRVFGDFRKIEGDSPKIVGGSLISLKDLWRLVWTAGSLQCQGCSLWRTRERGQGSMSAVPRHWLCLERVSEACEQPRRHVLWTRALVILEEKQFPCHGAYLSEVAFDHLVLPVVNY